MYWLGQRHPHAIALASVLLLLCTACRSPVCASSADHPTPEASERKIESLFIAGDLSSAQAAAEDAYNDRSPRDAFWQARFLVERARILIYRGHTAEAVALLSPALPATADPGTMARRAILLGMARGRLGDLPGSAAAFASAEEMHPQSLVASELFGARGSVALGQGRLDLAEPLFRNALTIAEQEKESFQQTQMLMNLGVVALQQQHYEEALDLFHRASSIAQAIGAKLAQQFALGNLGSIYYQTGDFIRGRDTSRAAAAQAAAQGATLSQAASLKNAGNSAYQLNDLAGARALYEQSLALAERIQSVDKIFDAHQALGYLLLHGDPVLAAEHIHEATRLATQRNHPGDILEQQFAESLLLAQQNQSQQAIVRLRRFDQQTGALPSLYWQAEGALARLYDEDSNQTQAEYWYRRSLETFRRQRLSLRSLELELPFLGNGNDLYFAYMDHLIRQHQPEAALELLDRSRAETLADGLYLNRNTPRKTLSPTLAARAVAAHLDATILVYCLRPGASYLWSVTQSGENFYRLPGKETLLPLIRRHNQSILASDDLLAAPQATGRALYDALIQPALGTPPKPGSRVILIADEELHDLNFETLIPPTGPPHYWIEDVTITNARSLRLLQASFTPNRLAEPRNALIIGAPIYRDTEYPELPNASTELTEIAQHFPASSRTILRGPEAVPAAYAASKPGAFSYIHFVAHATSNETSPLDSAIVLSKPTSQPFAYRLYARDILNEPLRADLVTISACYGSGRRSYSGEGLVGLAWAFLRAGAHNVIGALWEVSDASTPQLMDRLYTGLLAGQPPDAALREAKLATIHAGGAFRKPLYWAPFQIYSGS